MGGPRQLEEAHGRQSIRVGVPSSPPPPSFSSAAGARRRSSLTRSDSQRYQRAAHVCAGTLGSLLLHFGSTAHLEIVSLFFRLRSGSRCSIKRTSPSSSTPDRSRGSPTRRTHTSRSHLSANPDAFFPFPLRSGNGAAYNAAKAAIKSLTESLAHELRQRPHSNVTAHLFMYVPFRAPLVRPQPDPAAPGGRSRA